MKKITFFCFVAILQLSFGQSVVYTTDFSDNTYPSWAFYDQDGDTFNWGDINQIGDGMGGFITPPSLISRSWQGAPLTPDNWAVSPPIDLTNASGSIDLEYITQVAAASWDEEKYSIYISTSNNITTLTGLSPNFTNTLGDVNDTGTPVTHNFDLSSYAGQIIYIVFRHWDCTDQDFLAIHSMEVTATTLSNDEFNINKFNYYVDNQNYLNLSADQSLSQINIFNLLGQEVLNKQLFEKDERIDLNNFSNGVYLAQVKINGKIQTFKFVKN